MKTIVIDVKNVTTPRGFHRVVKKAINAPDYYGYNLDALNDVLTSINEDVTLIFKNYGALTKAMPDYSDMISEFFEAVENENSHLTIEMKD